MENYNYSKYFRFLQLFLVIFILVGITSCGSGKKSVDTKFQSGKEGVSIGFMTNAPPSVIYVGSDIKTNEIPIELEVYNKGTSKTNVEIVFHGYDSDIIEIEPEKAEFQQEDSFKSRYTPNGGYESVSTKLSIKEMISDTYSFPLKVTYCYKYETIASKTICVDPAPDKQIRGDSCTPSKVTTDGQGGPVGIESIESEPMPGKVRLKTVIRKYSKAEIAFSNTVNACQGDISKENIDIVRVSEVTLGDTKPESCNNVDDKIKLRDGVGELICTFTFDNDVSYSYNTIFKAKIDYLVKDSTEKNIKIINEDYANR